MTGLNDQKSRLKRKIETKNKRISEIDRILAKGRFGYPRRRKYQDERLILTDEIKKLQDELLNLEL
jgi:predicted  nucleic acid-binding Zn-ribbon protein